MSQTKYFCRLSPVCILASRSPVYHLYSVTSRFPSADKHNYPGSEMKIFALQARKVIKNLVRKNEKWPSASDSCWRDMEPAIHTFGNRKYQSWKAHRIRLQVWNFTSGGCKEGVQCHQAQPSHRKRGPLPDDKLQTQRMNCPFSQPMDQSPKGQTQPGPQLPGW